MSESASLKSLAPRTKTPGSPSLDPGSEPTSTLAAWPDTSHLGIGAGMKDSGSLSAGFGGRTCRLASHPVKTDERLGQWRIWRPHLPPDLPTGCWGLVAPGFQRNRLSTVETSLIG